MRSCIPLLELCIKLIPDSESFKWKVPESKAQQEETVLDSLDPLLEQGKQVQISDCRVLEDGWLVALACRQPRSLTLHRCHHAGQAVTDRGLQRLFHRCGDVLQELNVTSCSGPGLTGDKVLLHAGALCSRLTAVDISWSGATDVGVMALIQGASRSIGSLALQCPHLQILNIGRVPKVSETCLVRSLKNLGELTALNVAGLKMVRNQIVHLIVMRCPKLDSLVLSSCSQVTDVSLVEISTYLRTLRVCSLANYCHISLECVKLSFCKNVTLDVVKKLCKNCRRKEQVSTLYQNINLVEPRLIQPYEHVIKNFIREIKLQSTEMESLAIAVKRAQDKAAMQLSELEEEMDQRIQAAEHKTRKDEKRKAEEALSDLRRQYETEVGDLQVTIKKLKKLEEQSKHVSQKEDVAALKRQIYDLSMENQKVKKDLLEAQTNIAFLQSELDALKSDYADQSLNSERDLEIIREYTEDRNSLERQIEILQTANRKLHDSNDGLRSALENTYSKFNRSLRVNNTSPGNTSSRSSPKFNGHSPQPPGYDRSSRSSYVDEDCDSLALCDPMQRVNCEVDSLPESCFDSGLSTLRDSNEYDSEVEYKHQRAFPRSHGMRESSAGDASDTDVPDIRDEETYGSDGVASVLDWKPPVSEGSVASYPRKPILALSPQTDMADENRSSSSQKAYKIVLAGDAAVGKSSFLMRLCKNEFRGNTSATLGVDFQMKTLIVDGERTVLQLWDTAEKMRKRFRSIAKSYFRRADGVLLLYDVTCEKSFLNVREWVDMIEDAATESIPIMLVGNKADLRESAAAEGEKCVPAYFGEKLAMLKEKERVSYFEKMGLVPEGYYAKGQKMVQCVTWWEENRKTFVLCMFPPLREVKKRTDEDDSKSITNLSGSSSKQSSHMKNCCKG
ncbi:Ras and EF-hand domain-containing protein [Myotis brandtii]|uniref:Ras and EF-hand domain-containing protein n=1 Tax=Myotis brandtii TaxID=109478 RepID=S7PLP5_MYOBR|nr:Ras and EF-hand domain-containing protein [Myotis brandtii]